MFWWILFLLSGILMYKLYSFVKETSYQEILWYCMRLYTMFRMYIDKILKYLGWFSSSTSDKIKSTSSLESEYVEKDDASFWVHAYPVPQGDDAAGPSTAYVISTTQEKPATYTLTADPFMCLEFKGANDDSSISLSLGTPASFFVEGNRLCGKPFLTWYLMKYHNYRLEEGAEYKVEGIDQETNMIEWGPEEEIEIVKKSDTEEDGIGYRIIKRGQP